MRNQKMRDVHLQKIKRKWGPHYPVVKVKMEVPQSVLYGSEQLFWTMLIFCLLYFNRELKKERQDTASKWYCNFNTVHHIIRESSKKMGFVSLSVDFYFEYEILPKDLHLTLPNCFSYFGEIFGKLQEKMSECVKISLVGVESIPTSQFQFPK